ncbi:MAG TPA: PilZ domain-containing protein [Pyrinomonadaceae bacterium]|jgi:hypothetical protein
MITAIDRRTGGDRRAAPRYVLRLAVEWETAGGKKSGTVNDISREGCFVLCSGEVDDGMLVALYFPLNEGGRIEFMCEVTNHTYEIGFGVRFSGLSFAQREYLSKLIGSLR